jgi:hypothetical protein
MLVAVIDTYTDAEVRAESLARDPIKGLRNYQHQRIPATGSVVPANRERTLSRKLR